MIKVEVQIAAVLLNCNIPKLKAIPRTIAGNQWGTVNKIKPDSKNIESQRAKLRKQKAITVFRSHRKYRKMPNKRTPFYY